MSNINEMHLSPKTFKKMFNLRLLKFYESSQNLWELTTRSSHKVQFREGLNKVSFGELRSFIWYGYPLTVPSSNFDPKNLVEFDLSESNLERLWDDTKHAPKLRWLILRQCLRLTEIPDLSKSPLLERIDLRGCLSLTKILNLSKLPLLKEIDLKGCSTLTEIPNLSESPLLKTIDLSGCLSLTKILNLSKLSLLKEIDLNGCSSLIEIPNLSESPLLKKIDLNDCRSLLEFPLLAPRLNYLSDLNLSGCASIRSFPSTIIHFESIGSLNLSSCINLTTFPQISGNITCLDLSGTAIDEVPPSIENLIKLFHLALPKSIRLISTNICKLKSLWKLDLTNCFQLESFPEILDEMEGLEILDLSGTAIKELPHSIEELTNLSALYLSRCKNLEKLPSSISNLISLQQLNILDCPKLEKLPNNLGNLKSLEDLSIDGIIISQLPSTMMYLNIDVSITISCRGYRELRFTDLLGLTWGSLTSLDFNDCNLNKIPVVIGWLSSLEVLKLSGNNFESLPLTMKLLYNLTYLEVDNCNMLQSLTDLPSALRDLSASGCNMLQSLTELPSALRHLSASGCKQLQSIPDASEFANLDDAEFIFTNCLNLKETAVSKMLATLKKVYEEGKEIGELTFFVAGK